MATLTTYEVEKRLKKIRGITWDDEVAHGLEDALYVDVLGAVAAGHADAKKLARIALRATRYKFSRWAA